MPRDFRNEQLRSIKTLHQLVTYLSDELDWPIESDDFDTLTFDYTAEELGIDSKTAAKILEIKQLRPLTTDQPWGIFFVRFEPKQLPVVALRRILGRLVFRKRQTANAAERRGWNKQDLLFISSYGEGEGRQISFAHFTDNDQHGDLPTLRVLGWDQQDTVLKLDHLHGELCEKLRWPDDDSDISAWRDRWASAFTLKHREVITTSKQLAIRLADLASGIRKRVNTALKIETDKGPLTTLMSAFRQALIHDLKPDDFADMYAQTIAYGLLTARVSRPAGLVADSLADMVPTTNPFLKELMETFLNLGGRRWNSRKGKLTGIDFDELGVNDVVDLLRAANMEAVLRDFGNRNPREDPVIHFYELFLKEYDAKKRMQRGVFYTPRPVVSYIVRSVHELLQTEFGLADGLADTSSWADMLKKHKDLKLPQVECVDPKSHKLTKRSIDPKTPFVQILDPATGTATFLVEVIDVIHKTMLAKWKSQGKTELFDIPSMWNEYVPKHLLPRLHGYELMMAPYAIAHMKLGLKLHETDYKFGSKERARIYLTNALEPPQDFSDTFEQMAPALAHEAKAVNDVKRHQRFTVVVGNPPYSGHSANESKNPDGTPNFIGSLLRTYFAIDGKPLGERNPKWLQDDYVKFISFSQWVLSNSAVGLLGFITNHAYLDNPTFRGLRFSLLRNFQRIRLLDLHGNVMRREALDTGGRDENVFDIQQGVSIMLAARITDPAETDVSAGHAIGSRESKYALLLSPNAEIHFQGLSPTRELFLFASQDVSLAAEFQAGFDVRKAFPVNNVGIVTGADSQAIADTRHDAVSLATTHKLPADSVKPILYRPFDFKFIVYDKKVVTRPRLEVMPHLFSGPNRALIFMRQVALQDEYSHFGVADQCVDNRAFYSNKGILSVAPLYLYPQSGQARLQDAQKVELNLAEAFINALQESMGASGDRMVTRDPETVFDYVYGVFSSPTYRSRYAPFLRLEFPRIPLPRKRDLFSRISRIGAELVKLHLMKAAVLEQPLSKYTGLMTSEVEKLSYANDTVWLDKKQTCGFAGVPEAVWNFHIGGYQVCAKWLKDRKGRRLSTDDIAHYQKIVVALSETIRLMKEIDEVIEKHGGWPGAFATGKE